MNYSQRFTSAQPKRSHRAPDLSRLRQHMCNELVRRGITQKNVLYAMSTVPRHLFVQDALRSQAYEDAPLPIGYGQTISQPYTVARMSELLEVEKGMRVLEIGTGSGYQTAILAQMGCHIISIERLQELFRKTQTLLHQLGFRGIHLQRGDGTLGCPQAAPFDRIIVTAGGPKIPEPLLDQLDPENGILLMPVGSKQRIQEFIKIRKVHGVTRQEACGSTTFVNLIGSYGWRFP
ncbi:MAG: protein-L-isoaspartate(D-aspartate) O-methyltransferase [Desulfovibrio sp.]|nr:protein-L-isoaspartate(D-aspartate) O-methyltransferase [Desulfovibrio sp.]